MGSRIKCSHILVQKQSEAITILDKIKKGEKFGKLAREFSTDSGSAKRTRNSCTCFNHDERFDGLFGCKRRERSFSKYAGLS